LLQAFARKCALEVAGYWDAPGIVIRYLETGDESLRYAARSAAARYAAESARSAAARYAAESAAWYAQSAAESAARSAAESAAWSAAESAARSEHRRVFNAMVSGALK
jgi:hypothetical protein